MQELIVSGANGSSGSGSQAAQASAAVLTALPADQLQAVLRAAVAALIQLSTTPVRFCPKAKHAGMRMCADLARAARHHGAPLRTDGARQLVCGRVQLLAADCTVAPHGHSTRRTRCGPGRRCG